MKIGSVGDPYREVVASPIDLVSGEDLPQASGEERLTRRGWSSYPEHFGLGAFCFWLLVPDE